MNKFTIGNNDVDWKIFDELNDRDLLALCQTSKEMRLMRNYYKN